MNCSICTAPYIPKHKSQKTCLDAICRAEQKRQDKIAKSERQTIRARKEAIKTRSDYIREADAAASAYIRFRDRLMPCICCGMPLNSDGGVPTIGGSYDCGHYISRRHLSTRWNENNLAGQRKFCNRYQSGNQAMFRLGLIDRFGIEAVIEVEQEAKLNCKVSTAEIINIRDYYKVKLKELKKAAA